MNHSEITKLLTRLSKATRNMPDPVEISVLVESILDNHLTDEEVMRGYTSTRDSPEPWWPKPGEFLARARPTVPNSTLHRTEAEAVFAAIIDYPHRYGDYNPHTGRIYDRRRIESAHGKAAGCAFAAIASRFRSADDDGKGLVFMRREFIEAYIDARVEYPAPNLTPPSRQIPSSQEKAIESASAPAPGPSQEARLDALIRSVPQGPPRPSFDDRLRHLATQARELLS